MKQGKYVLLTPAIVNGSNDNTLSLPHGDNRFLTIKLSCSLYLQTSVKSEKMKMQNYCTVQIEAALKTQQRECTCIILQIKKNTHYLSPLLCTHICDSKTAEIKKLVKIKKTFFYDVIFKGKHILKAINFFKVTKYRPENIICSSHL